MKYVTDSWGTDENGFKMVITAFKSVTQRGCHNSFQCSSPNTCISHDLVCDGKSHCMDGSDERHSEFCRCKYTYFLIWTLYLQSYTLISKLLRAKQKKNIVESEEYRIYLYVVKILCLATNTVSSYFQIFYILKWTETWSILVNIKTL